MQLARERDDRDRTRSHRTLSVESNPAGYSSWRPPRLRLWETPSRSNRGANSQPGSVWCPDRRAPVARWSCWGSAKGGDTYWRTLLIHGARGVLYNAKDPGAWVERIGKPRPPDVVLVALANKMARTTWAILAHDRPYGKNLLSRKPAWKPGCSARRERIKHRPIMEDIPHRRVALAIECDDETGSDRDPLNLHMTKGSESYQSWRLSECLKSRRRRDVCTLSNRCAADWNKANR